MGGGGGRGRSGDGDRAIVTIPALMGTPTTGLEGTGGTPLTRLALTGDDDGLGAGGRIGARGRGGGGLESWFMGSLLSTLRR